MNADDQHHQDQGREQQAAELDDLAQVLDDMLSELVLRHGLCLWEITSGDPPDWSGHGPPDRELAARLCAGCPVRRECLEFDLRSAGPETVGVWGGLSENDRRALHAIWATRRSQRRPDDTNETGDQQKEGGER